MCVVLCSLAGGFFLSTAAREEFSLALLGLMTSVKQRAPGGIRKAEVLLCDQFVEHVQDGSLRWELKQFVRRQPDVTIGG